MTEPQTYDEAVQQVHRAFCDPDHELVGEWDREMAEALQRNGYAIVEVGAGRAVQDDGRKKMQRESSLRKGWFYYLIDALMVLAGGIAFGPGGAVFAALMLYNGAMTWAYTHD